MSCINSYNWKKIIGKSIRKARKEQGLTLVELAKKVNSNKSTISQIERGEFDKIDNILFNAITEILEDYRLALLRCQFCQSGIFAPPELNNASRDLITSLRKLREEHEEAIEAIDDIFKMKLENRPHREDISNEEYETLLEKAKQLYDTQVGTPHVLILMSFYYDICLQTVKNDNFESLIKNRAVKYD